MEGGLRDDDGGAGWSTTQSQVRFFAMPRSIHSRIAEAMEGVGREVFGDGQG